MAPTECISKLVSLGTSSYSLSRSSLITSCLGERGSPLATPKGVNRFNLSFRSNQPFCVLAAQFVNFCVLAVEVLFLAVGNERAQVDQQLDGLGDGSTGTLKMSGCCLPRFPNPVAMLRSAAVCEVDQDSAGNHADLMVVTEGVSPVITVYGWASGRPPVRIVQRPPRFLSRCLVDDVRHGQRDAFRCVIMASDMGCRYGRIHMCFTSHPGWVCQGSESQASGPFCCPWGLLARRRHD